MALQLQGGQEGGACRMGRPLGCLLLRIGKGRCCSPVVRRGALWQQHGLCCRGQAGGHPVCLPSMPACVGWGGKMREGGKQGSEVGGGASSLFSSSGPDLCFGPMISAQNTAGPRSYHFLICILKKIHVTILPLNHGSFVSPSIYFPIPPPISHPLYLPFPLVPPSLHPSTSPALHSDPTSISLLKHLP